MSRRAEPEDDEDMVGETATVDSIPVKLVLPNANQPICFEIKIKDFFVHQEKKRIFTQYGILHPELYNMVLYNSADCKILKDYKELSRFSGDMACEATITFEPK